MGILRVLVDANNKAVRWKASDAAALCEAKSRERSVAGREALLFRCEAQFNH